jgi:hypothetical protein
MVLEAMDAHARRAALEQAPACGQPPAIAELKALGKTVTALMQAVGLDDPDGEIRPDARRLTATLEPARQAARALLASLPQSPPGYLLAQLAPATRRFVIVGWRRPWRFMERVTPHLARMMERMGPESSAPAPATASGTGRGRALTSRGPLYYSVAFDKGRVSACKASTPTGRMTAPDGTLSRHLSCLPDNENTAALAQLVALAANPCAATRIHFAEAGHA